MNNWHCMNGHYFEDNMSEGETRTCCHPSCKAKAVRFTPLHDRSPYIAPGEQRHTKSTPKDEEA